ncbi:MAG TPA: MogA/MoaB family molybdenum cofactor biosynthesis protein [Candidatus Acidoferrales bacterium]|nr:MogA/MoaB family molybdenum cofactor biosynthesis protein [Candidatus Acidoferrales bacterium]
MRIAVITVSDSVARNEREDATGPAIAALATEHGWRVLSRHVISDDMEPLSKLLASLADRDELDVILTAGGTGLGPRDSTPEATAAVCARLVPGLGELMRQEGRKSNELAALSRAAAGIRGRTLIVNLPGSPRGAVESLQSVAALLPHAVEVLRGARHD